MRRKRKMIATSIEQSYKLLEAGLSQDSADMHWSSRKMEMNPTNGCWMIVKGDLWVGKCENENDLPAWSCARLIEINKGVRADVYKSDETIQCLVTDTKFLLEMGDIDEEYVKK